jgi:Periplasmic copper-binding protein (NosD)
MRFGLLLSLALAVPLHAAVRLQINDSVPGPSLPLDPHQARTFYVSASADRGEFNGDVRVDVAPFGGAAIESLTATRGTCDAGGCSIGRLDSLDAVTITVVVRAGDFASHTPEGFVASSPSASYSVQHSFDVYRLFTVANGDDGGAGSLRQAIVDANTACGEDECKITFADGLVIAPRSPLPAVTANRITIDGASHTELTGALAGGSAHGLTVTARCTCRVLGMNIHDFALYAIDFEPGHAVACGVSLQSVENNTLTRNLRGIRADNFAGSVQGNVIRDNRRSGIWYGTGVSNALNVIDNRIEHNGASGIYVDAAASHTYIAQNTIAGNAEMGVAVSRRAGQTEVVENVFRGNGGEAIDWGLDGADRILPNHVDPVRIDAAHYDPATDTTTVDFTIDQYWSFDRSVDFDSMGVAFYVNEDPRNQGEQLAGETSRQVDTRPQSFRTALKGDLSGKWLTATATLRVITERVMLDPRQSTSEFSNAVLVTK